MEQEKFFEGLKKLNEAIEDFLDMNEESQEEEATVVEEEMEEETEEI